MSTDNLTIFGQFPAPIKLEAAGCPQVIRDYLINQDIFVKNEQLVRVSAKDEQNGFILIRIDETWQLAKVLGRISEEEGDFPAWASFNDFSVLQLFEECTPSQRVLAKLGDTVAWETFHHLFTRAWLKTFVDRQNDPGHYANGYDSPTIVSRGKPELEHVFDKIDGFQKNQKQNKTELQECIEMCTNLFNQQMNPGDKSPSFFCVVSPVVETAEDSTDPGQGDEGQHTIITFSQVPAVQPPTIRAQMSPKVGSRLHLHRAAKKIGRAS